MLIFKDVGRMEAEIVQEKKGFLSKEEFSRSTRQTITRAETQGG